MSVVYLLNDKVKEMKPYEPAVGDYPVRLDANESFVPLPDSIKEEICSAVAKIDYRRYPEPIAEACLKNFAAIYGLDSDNLTAGNGSDELISVILGGLFQRGDKILITRPDFSMYEFYAHMSELQAVSYIKKEYRIDVDELIALSVREKCRGIIFSNPCNPTSQGISREETVKILEALPSSLIIVDEAYMEFWNQSVLDLINKYDNLIVLKTCSKAFGGAAIRLGFAVTNKSLTKTLRSIKSPYNVNSLTQAAGAVILSHRKCLNKAIEQILSSRDELYKCLTTLRQQPINEELGIKMVLDSKTNFILAEFNDNKAVFEYLKNKGILVRFFPDFLRITTGSQEENQRLITALQNYRRIGNEKGIS